MDLTSSSRLRPSSMEADRMSTDRMSTADLSEAESDTSSVMGDTSSFDSSMKPPSPASREHMQKRIESLKQENLVLKMELETYKSRNKVLVEENKTLKQASVAIQAKAEQEEEFISNTLLKKIKDLKREKEALALNYEQEEECLTNDLSRKLNQLRSEKAELAASLQQEQESLVNRLLRRIRKLEAETATKQTHLEQLRREKVELENTLEQEQEALVNRLWKRMDKLEAEKRSLQERLDQPISAPPSPMEIGLNGEGTSAGRSSDARLLTQHIQHLRSEVSKLKQQLRSSQSEHSERMAQLSREEQQIREQNLRLQRKLQMELERREQLCRHLSESESSLEMEDERHFNELSNHGGFPNLRNRAISSPVSSAAATTGGGRPVSPAPTTPTAGNTQQTALNVNVALNPSLCLYNPPSPLSAHYHHRCVACGTPLPPQHPQVQALLQNASPNTVAATANFVASNIAPISNPAVTGFMASASVTRTRSTGEAAVMAGSGGSSNNVNNKGPSPNSSASNPSIYSSSMGSSGMGSCEITEERFLRPTNPPPGSSRSGSVSPAPPQSIGNTGSSMQH